MSSKAKKDSQFPNPEPEHMPSPIQRGKEVNFHENDSNQKKDTQEYPDLYPAKYHHMKDYIRIDADSPPSAEDHSEAKTGSPEPPTESYVEAKAGLPQPKLLTIGIKILSPIHSTIIYAPMIAPSERIVTISCAKITGSVLEYLVSWFPSFCTRQQWDSGIRPRDVATTTTFGTMALICWHPIWKLAQHLPLDALISYYNQNSKEFPHHV
ncbi:hypothetical protein AOQ84DRAFT_368701 [Glonium stellatum]|uniref:Uncharacterized protein n=1 Tax=Glonium stellatum TaxID=574774 RepID=A0A8E2EQM0_9PEZI|nr:hypothetical protein AOQ84DRAFT_368701 [Glonium stellatum]